MRLLVQFIFDDKQEEYYVLSDKERTEVDVLIDSLKSFKVDHPLAVDIYQNWIELTDEESIELAHGKCEPQHFFY